MQTVASHCWAESFCPPLAQGAGLAVGQSQAWWPARRVCTNLVCVPVAQEGSYMSAAPFFGRVVIFFMRSFCDFLVAARSQSVIQDRRRYGRTCAVSIG